MRKALIAGIALLSMVTVAEAQQRHYHHHRGGGGGWVAPLVGGMVLGGVLYGLSQPSPVYGAPQPYYQQPVTCWEEFVGYNRWGNPVYRRVCQ